MFQRLTKRTFLLLLILILSLLYFSSIRVLRGDTYRPGEIPGVAFSLTPDYGTAAIRTSDGYVKVAKIEASAAFTKFMRKEERPRWLSDAICNHLPFPCPRASISDVSSTKALLSKLRASVESYLGTGICFVNVGMPDPLQADRYQLEVIQQTIESIGLRQVSWQTYEASTPAIQVNFAQRKDRGKRPRVILTIDYSGYALNLRLYYLDTYEDESFIEWARHDYNLTLGASSSGPLWHREAMRASIEAISRGPFGHPRQELPDQIGRLVLYGDSVQDQDFRTVLDEVLGSELMSKVEEFEPVFVSAMGMAKFAYDTVNEGIWVFDKKPAWGCCWNSRYHNCLGDDWQHRVEGGEL